MKKFIKKSLLFAFIFTTFIGGAFASSRLPNGKKPNERLMANLRGAVRILDAYYDTGRELEKQSKARNLVVSVLSDAKFHDHAILAFEDVERERLDDYKEALKGTDQAHIRAMYRGIENLKAIRRDFGL